MIIMRNFNEIKFILTENENFLSRKKNNFKNFKCA